MTKKLRVMWMMCVALWIASSRCDVTTHLQDLQRDLSGLVEAINMHRDLSNVEEQLKELGELVQRLPELAPD